MYYSIYYAKQKGRFIIFVRPFHSLCLSLILAICLFSGLGYFAFFITGEWWQDLWIKLLEKQYGLVLLSGVVGLLILAVLWFLALVPILSLIFDFRDTIINNIYTKKYILAKETQQFIEVEWNLLDGEAKVCHPFSEISHLKIMLTSDSDDTTQFYGQFMMRNGGAIQISSPVYSKKACVKDLQKISMFMDREFEIDISNIEGEENQT